ncbi:hypothetical protein ASPVEDRAFT_46700 [Aspergillus versicolor CBS 583.65]|uniref:Uncharacterized protein n=1 Tax=Aspergillus versicolor CBS 583.65 TaxID=1036611 RepID=A0A1L9Q0Q8_ASPVE|nr:uncharacterized protein ASPVEDRAFT_46700 [Aspergillus versicolor CBS 583.65]OJJ07358.1 hypothetical protein ASPVEDRAFT_46700 [Aspergillus versicolor CBS 583.65]
MLPAVASAFPFSTPREQRERLRKYHTQQKEYAIPRAARAVFAESGAFIRGRDGLRRQWPPH